MTTHAELIERLERAGGPDRELDAEIAATLRLYSGEQLWVSGWRTEWRAINGLVHILGDHGSHGNFRPPPYTGSIDTALTLVPEGFQWLVRTHDREPDGERNGFGKPAFANVLFGNGDDDPMYPVYADTIPIALCIAAIRARAGERT